MSGEISIGTVAAFIRLDTGGLVSGVAASNRALDGLASSANSKLATIQRRSSMVGTAMLAMGGAITAGLAESAKAAADFQRQMELVHTQAGASQKQVESLSKSVLNLAPAVGTGPEALSKALYHIVSVGVPAAQQMNVLKIAAEGAKVGLADTEETTNALASTMVSGIKGITSASQAMGTLNAVIGAGNMRMGDLNAALGTGILATARSFGLSIQDIGAALATMTDAGIPAQQAATRLRMTLSLMASPSEIAIKALNSIGLGATTLADDMRKPNGLVIAIEDLDSHLKKSGKSATEAAQIVSTAFGRGRSSSGILTLLENLDRLQTKYGKVTDGAKNFGEDWAATQKTAAFQMDQFRSSMDALAIESGTVLLPQVTSLVKGLTGLVKNFNDLNDSTKANITIGTEVVGGMLLVGGGVLKLISIVGSAKLAWAALTGAETAAAGAAADGAVEVGGIGAAIGGLVTPIGAIVLAMGGLVLAWDNDWGHIREVTYNTVDDIEKKINNSSIGNWINKHLGDNDGTPQLSAAELSGANLKPLPGSPVYEQQHSFSYWTKHHPASMKAAAEYAKQNPSMAAWISTHPAAAATGFFREQGPAGAGVPSSYYSGIAAAMASGGKTKGGAGEIVDNIGVGEASLKQRGVTDTDVVVRFIGKQSQVAEAAMKLHQDHSAENFRHECQVLARTTIESASSTAAKVFEQYGGHAGSALLAQSQLLSNRAALAAHGIQVGTVGQMGVQKGDLIYTGQRVNAQFGHVMTAISGKEDPISRMMDSQAKQEARAAKKELTNEHKYLHDINEALRKRHEQLMRDLELGAQAHAELQQQVLGTEQYNAQGNPLKEYAAQQHRIMVDMPNGPYAPGYYANRQAQLGALNRETQGSLLGQWQEALQQLLQAKGAFDVMTPSDPGEGFGRNGQMRPGEAAYFASIPPPSFPTDYLTYAVPPGQRSGKKYNDYGDPASYLQKDVTYSLKQTDKEAKKQNQQIASFDSSIARTISSQLMDSLSKEMQKSFKGPIGHLLSSVLSDVMGTAIEAAIKQAIVSSGVNSLLGGLTGGLGGGGLGGLGLILGGGLALGSLVGGLFGGGSSSTTQTSASHTVNVNFDQVHIHDGRSVQRLGEAVAWHAANRLAVIGG
jgi:TP901 family phage tail tape measure protein